MKAIFCIIMSLLAMVCPTKSIKNYCKKLVDTAYVISTPNKDNQKSIAVRVFPHEFLKG